MSVAMTLKSHTKAVSPPARFDKKFQVACNVAESSTSPNASMVTVIHTPLLR